jgi:hypothetical protein
MEQRQVLKKGEDEFGILANIYGSEQVSVGGDTDR